MPSQETYLEYLKRKGNPYAPVTYELQGYELYKGMITVMEFTGPHREVVDTIICEIACFAKDAGFSPFIDNEGLFSLRNMCDIIVGTDPEEGGRPCVHISAENQRAILGRDIYVLLEDGATYYALEKLKALIASYRGDWGGRIRIDGRP